MEGFYKERGCNMKKLIKALLIVIAVFVLLQAAIGGTAALGNALSSHHAQSTGFTDIASVQNIQVLACLNGHGYACVKPNVGWNT
jgi:hypothetical protein